MLLEPYCFIKYVEEQGVELLKHIDNWSEGSVFCYFFDEDLIVDMSECIHISVAEQYLKKNQLGSAHKRITSVGLSMSKLISVTIFDKNYGTSK